MTKDKTNGKGLIGPNKCNMNIKCQILFMMQIFLQPNKLNVKYLGSYE
jgi:hypothetical protein